MKTIEIMGGKLDLAFKELGIDAIKTAETDNEQDYYLNYQVWEMNEEEWYKLTSISDSEWKEEYGWWREGEAQSSETKEFVVNGVSMIGLVEEQNEFDEDEDEGDVSVDGDKAFLNFKNIADYYFNYLHISTEYNFVYFTTTLAKLNNMKISEFVKTYY